MSLLKDAWSFESLPSTLPLPVRLPFTVIPLLLRKLLNVLVLRQRAKTSRVVPTCHPNEVMPTHESRLVESLAHRPEAVFEFIEQFLIFKREILEKALIMVLRCIGFFDLVLQLAQFGPGFGERLLLSNPKGSLRGSVLRFSSLCVSNARS